MPTTTTNLSLYKPTVGGDTDLWGGYLNDNFDDLDAIFKGDGTGTSVGLNVGTGKSLKVGGSFEASVSQNAKTQIKVNNVNAGASASAGVVLGTSSGDNGYVGANGGAASSALGGANALQITNLTAGPIVFATDTTERVRISATGNVGIGTSSPSTPLSLGSGTNDGYASKLRLFDDGGAANSTTSNSYGFGVSGTGVLAYNAGTGGLHAFFTANTERLRVDVTGKVGVGTSSPVAMLHVAGSASTAAIKMPNAKEIATVSATAATGTINYDITSQSVLYYTSNASANWTLNFRGSSGTSLNTLMETGETMTAVFMVTNGSTAYYNSAVQVDGNAVTPKWLGGSAPTSGNASSIDVYTYAIVKTASATFTVFASVVKFA